MDSACDLLVLVACAYRQKLPDVPSIDQSRKVRELDGESEVLFELKCAVLTSRHLHGKAAKIELLRGLIPLGDLLQTVLGLFMPT